MDRNQPLKTLAHRPMPETQARWGVGVFVIHLPLDMGFSLYTRKPSTSLFYTLETPDKALLLYKKHGNTSPIFCTGVRGVCLRLLYV